MKTLLIKPISRDIKPLSREPMASQAGGWRPRKEGKGWRKNGREVNEEEGRGGEEEGGRRNETEKTGNNVPIEIVDVYVQTDRRISKQGCLLGRGKGGSGWSGEE